MTPECLQKIKDLHAAGKSYQQIADATMYSYGYIQQLLTGRYAHKNNDINNYNVKFMPLYQQGLNDAEIERETGIDSYIVRYWRKCKGLKSNYRRCSTCYYRRQSQSVR